MLPFFPLEYKLRALSYKILINLILALVLFMSAEVGRSFGLEELPLAISVVWPPSGISTAAILLFGYSVWPGIVLGNFANNIFHLYTGAAFFGPLLAAAVITLGSLGQALVAGWIIRRYSSENYFNNLNDVFTFLIPGALLSCLISSFVGVSTLYSYGLMNWSSTFFAFLTFFLGDLFGVYVFTPLLVVWALNFPKVPVKTYLGDALIITIAFVFFGFLTIILRQPLLHLLFPFCIWASYRFRMHGATVAIFVLSWTALFLIAIGYGPPVGNSVAQQLLLSVSYLSMVVISSLIVAAAVKEKDNATDLLQKHNINLQEAVNLQKEKLKTVHSELYIKEKLAAASSLISSIFRQIIEPLKKIEASCKVSIETIRKLKESDAPQKSSKNLSLLTKNIKEIDKNRTFTQELLQIVEAQTVRTSPEKVKILSVNLHTLINGAINQFLEKNDLSISVIKDFDRNIPMISALPEDLEFAFNHLFENARESLHVKKKKLEVFHPEVKINTFDKEKLIEVVIRDNGIGIPKELLDDFFQTLKSTKKTDPALGLGLFLVHEIICNVHHGYISVSSEEGEFLEITIRLPKNNILETC